MSTLHEISNIQPQKACSIRDKRVKKAIKHKTPASHLILAWSIVMALMIALELLR